MNSRRPHEPERDRLSAGGDALEVDALIDSVLDGELSPAARDAMLRRIEAHPGAKAELASLRRASESLRPPVQCPDFSKSVWREVAVRSALENPLAFRGHTGGWILPLSIAAGLALVAGATLLMLGLPGGAAPAATPRAPVAEAPVVPAPTAAPATSEPSRATALELGPTDRHEFRGNWDTHIKPESQLTDVTQIAATGEDGSAGRTIEPGRLISVRMGPAWTLWWVPGDAGSPQAKTMQLLTRISTPTNASVEKPGPQTPR